MYADYLLLGDSLKPQRIGFPEVALPGEGELFKVLLALDVVHIDARQLASDKAVLRGEPFQLGF